MGTELKDRKTLKEAVEAARLRLAKCKGVLSKAEETCMFAAPAAAKGGAKEKQALTRAEDAVVRLREEVAIAEREARQREAELDRFLAEGEELGRVEYARWMKELRAEVAKDGALLRENQERGILIAKRMAGRVLAAERRIPVKLVARRCNRVVRVEVLDEGLQASFGPTTSMGFFAARKEADAGRVRIIPDEKLTLTPEDFEYEKRTAPLPDDLEAVRNIDLGRLFPGSDMREEIDFNAIVAIIEEENTAAAKAAGRKS